MRLSPASRRDRLLVRVIHLVSSPAPSLRVCSARLGATVGSDQCAGQGGFGLDIGADLVLRALIRV